MPDVMRAASALLTSPIGEIRNAAALDARSRARPAAELGRATTVSTRVFQAAQAGHWPDHFGDAPPHCWQT
jgi:hypothetical protein